MLKDMSGLKMMGLTDVVGDIVQEERVKETKQMESWGWINTWQNVIGLFDPLLITHQTVLTQISQHPVCGCTSSDIWSICEPGYSARF
jgi:hypothetical protein